MEGNGRLRGRYFRVFIVALAGNQVCMLWRLPTEMWRRAASGKNAIHTVSRDREHSFKSLKCWLTFHLE